MVEKRTIGQLVVKTYLNGEMFFDFIIFDDIITGLDVVNFGFIIFDDVIPGLNVASFGFIIFDDVIPGLDVVSFDFINI
ncbi:hypothetical protein [Lederbergia citrea]|uniref:hypothetical protein n=1 Tax=Lederbergia citrea TaxID=2833581 RepID=UPI001BC9AAD5|nr:hypothetical protein [Lederbergia citrea]MBS4178455.1 hypothetical protein [Lederbergia citrea]